MNLDEFRKQKRVRPDWLVPQLSIRGGEVAKIRFLTDYPDIKIDAYHIIPVFNSSLGRNVYRNVFCTQQESQPCKLCETKVPIIWQWRAWAWCYYILRSFATPAAVEPVTIGDKVYYKENINAVRLFRRGPGRNYYIIASFKTFMNKYGTLCDRDYEWSRQGTRREDTTYALIPDEKVALAPEIQRAMSELMPLDEYIKKAYSLEVSSPSEGSVERLKDKLQQSVQQEDIGEAL